MIAVAETTQPGAMSGSSHLSTLRNEIERIDRDLVALIAERVQTACAIGEAKREAGLPTTDPVREAAVIRRSATLARDAGVSAEAVRDIFWRLVALSRSAQLDTTGGV